MTAVSDAVFNSAQTFFRAVKSHIEKPDGVASIPRFRCSLFCLISAERCFLREANTLFKAMPYFAKSFLVSLNRRQMILSSNLIHINDLPEIFDLCSKNAGQAALTGPVDATYDRVILRFEASVLLKSDPMSNSNVLC